MGGKGEIMWYEEIMWYAPDGVEKQTSRILPAKIPKTENMVGQKKREKLCEVYEVYEVCELCKLCDVR